MFHKVDMETTGYPGILENLYFSKLQDLESNCPRIYCKFDVYFPWHRFLAVYYTGDNSTLLPLEPFEVGVSSFQFHHIQRDHAYFFYQLKIYVGLYNTTCTKWCYVFHLTTNTNKSVWTRIDKCKSNIVTLLSVFPNIQRYIFVLNIALSFHVPALNPTMDFSSFQQAAL